MNIEQVSKAPFPPLKTLVPRPATRRPSVAMTNCCLKVGQRPAMAAVIVKTMGGRGVRMMVRMMMMMMIV